MTGQSVKHIDIGEFRRLGFLQEANRLFFHPHGLALEVTRVDDEENGDRALTRVALSDGAVAALRGLVHAERLRRSPGYHEDLDALTAALDTGIRYGQGDCWISGVWDYREDPEGIYFGDAPEDKAEKVATVAAERERHRAARTALFDAGPLRVMVDLGDIEPINWAAPGAVLGRFYIAERAPDDEERCRECGCSDAEPCANGCYWIAPGLCSAHEEDAVAAGLIDESGAMTAKAWAIVDGVRS